MANIMYGSVCISDVPRNLFKKVTLKDGTEKIYLNIKVVERKTPSEYGHTHFISCEPKQEERVEGQNYICGDLKTYVPKTAAPTAEQVASSPAASGDDLPF